jgi:catechol 2,3-dioxygenase-like lactoylglutathione lyase family enzyme
VLRTTIILASTACALSSLAAQAPADAGARLRLQSFSLIVRDYDEARDWYTRKLGFAVVRDQAFGKGERFLMVAPPGQTDLGIVLQKALREPNPDEPEMATDYSDRVGKGVNIVLRSNAVQEFADTLQARGVKLTAPVRVMPWGSQATFVDLYGNSFVVVGPPPARPAR